MSQLLSKLEQCLEYRFENPKLLEKALTHRSWAHEKFENRGDQTKRVQNERLEFVGDSVLGLAIAETLYDQNPEYSEGDLTLMKHHLVSAETLAKVANSLNLGDFVLIGRGEEKTGGRKKQAILADTLEAVIAAIFFDTGYLSAKRFIIRIFSNEIESVTPTSSLDYKTLLQETLQGEKRQAPTYRVIKTEGPSHNRLFTIEAAWDNGSTTGVGKSKKSAEMKAASLALKILSIEFEKQNAH